MSSLNNDRQLGKSKSKIKNKRASRASRYLNNFATTSMFASGISINEPGENAPEEEPLMVKTQSVSLIKPAKSVMKLYAK